MRRFLALAASIAAIATPASAHEFLSYFDYGRTELSPAGYQMVRDVAAYTKLGRTQRIAIIAVMDSREAEEFSDELSRRRAQAVATELVMLGIDPGLIEMRSADWRICRSPEESCRRLDRRVTVAVLF
jgi:outer membrane protein OmpA-like peptidoglycan-associated protein